MVQWAKLLSGEMGRGGNMNFIQTMGLIIFVLGQVFVLGNCIYDPALWKAPAGWWAIKMLIPSLFGAVVMIFGALCKPRQMY